MLFQLFLLVSLALAADSQAANVDPPKELQSLLEAEKAYAKLGADKGFRAAYLSVLSDAAVIFMPSAINGKKFWQESKEDLVISWRPAVASIAASYELG